MSRALPEILLMLLVLRNRKKAKQRQAQGEGVFTRGRESSMETYGS